MQFVTPLSASALRSLSPIARGAWIHEARLACQPSCCIYLNDTHSFMKWDCVSFQYAALQPLCMSELRQSGRQRGCIVSHSEGKKQSKPIFEDNSLDAWVRLKVRRRSTALMGCWDACSDCKRQTVLTGKAIDSLLSVSVEERKSKKALPATACVIYFMR